MFVITADQKGSRGAADQVPAALQRIEDLLPRGAGLVLPFERTAGDEIQGVIHAPGAALEVTLGLLARGHWYVGIGLGDVELPLGESARASRGLAFVRARRAIELAKVRGAPQPLAVVGGDPATADEAQSLLRLLGAVASRRSDQGHQACDAMSRLGSQRRAAEQLGISVQALSQRLRAAMYYAERECRPLAERLLAVAEATANLAVAS